MTTQHVNFEPIFDLGHIVATRGALEALQDDRELAALLLLRHSTGDYGDICEEDKKVNADALKYGSRIMSVYNLFGSSCLWIITEADRSSTTLLLPSEY
jgi:hypothetical protein